MDHAIISGSTGLIGSALVKFLISNQKLVNDTGYKSLSTYEEIVSNLYNSFIKKN